MLKFTHDKFGEIVISDNSPYLKVDMVVNGKKTRCGLYIGKDIAGNAELELTVKYILESLEELDKKARAILHQELVSGNQLVIDFIDFHLEEVLGEIQEKLGIDKIDHKTFIENLDLRALGLHYDGSDIECGFDYTIGEEFIDELLVVKFDSKGNLIEVAHES